MLFSVPVLRAPWLRSAVAVAFFGFSWANASHAQVVDDLNVLETVVVTASRTPESLRKVGAHVTVIDRQAIDRQSAGDLATLLGKQQGIEIARSGGAGSVTGVFIRGAAPRFTLMLIDGVPVHTQSTQGGVPWESIPLDDIERIEIVRGAGSAAYGTSAVAGVIQIFTKKGSPGPAQLSVGSVIGSSGLAKGDASISGAPGPLNYALTLAHEASDGKTAITNPALSAYASDRDGYAQQLLSGRLGFQLGQSHRVEVQSSSNRNRVQFDDGPNQPAPVSINKLSIQSLRWQANWLDGFKGLYQIGESDSGLVSNGQYPVNNRTKVTTLLIQHDWAWGNHALQSIFERREDKFTDQSEFAAFDVPSRKRYLNGAGLGYVWRGDSVTLSSRIRHDRDSDEGNYTTGAVSADWVLNDVWRARASMANAFRAPTLYERFATYGGNPSLKPEVSTGIDLGINWSKGAASWDVTLYRNRIREMITYGDEGYENTARAKLDGLSASWTMRLSEITLQGGIDLQNPRDDSTGERLLRVAKRTAKLSADTDWMGWTLGSQLQVSGAREDIAYPSRVKLGGYAVADVYAQKTVSPQWSLLIRANNVFDKRYETVYGYGQSGTSGLIALRFNSRR